MFKKEGLILNVLLAVVAGFFMNYAIYQHLEETETSRAFCAVIDDGYMPNPSQPTIALAGEEAVLFDQGLELFEANCAQCHAVNEQVVGPALRHVQQRWPDPKVLTQFIKYPQRMIDSGKSPYALALYKKYKQYMPNHDFFSDEDVAAILFYIKHSTTTPVSEEALAVN